ncbi:hypothetical protein NPIL_261331 [Nephila pilipes]|uniref:C2H2-type domain-containing protein n=1 Tax=Nephila pilipes TaxID=299642 RepID=A0A8X6N8K5_NEPPI|nr:hypothetical protein NPIL_261331 [Nephila pilipes]
MSVESTNQNQGPEEENRIRRVNDTKEYLMKEMKLLNSTNHSPVQSSSSSTTSRTYGQRFPDDDGREITKCETHNLVGKEKLKKETNPLKTSDCDNSFISENAYLRNKVTGDTHTHKTRIFRCEICGKQFKSSCDLKRHIRVKNGDRPYPCDCCNKTFTQSNNRTKHVRIYTRAKVHSCGQCPKFITPSDLSWHQL